MMLIVVLSFLIFILSVIFGLILYARWNYGVLEATGIPIIKPKLFLGSVPDLHSKIQTDEDIQRFRENGPIWGLYEGRTPTIYVCDPELIRSIFVRDLDYFFDRRINHFDDPRIDEILDYLPGEKWRKMRKLQTVLFSSGKIKQYNTCLGSAAYDFIENLKMKCDEDRRVKIDTRHSMDILSLDGIARVSFGVKLENVEDPKNAFFRALKRLLGEGQEFTWLYSLSMVFPFLTKLAPSFQIESVLFDTFKEIVDTRRIEREKLENSPCNDLADLLADCYSKLDTPEYKKLGITETTLLAQALNVTALDMISATMTMMSYYLAKNPEIQSKLHEEIDSIIVGKHGGLINNETVHELTYLSACINETLRLAPPLIRPERECTKDWSSPDGKIKIKKGTVVMVPLWAAHRNPEYFPDPEKFEPSRFLAPNTTNPYAFSPFGLGPRNCIGMRLAYETLKVNLCIILKDFSYELRSDTVLGFKPGVLYLLQFHPMFLDMVRRN